MPELPDITLYLEALERRVLGHRLEAIRIFRPFLLRSVRPAPEEAAGRRVESLHRLGKRIVLGLEGDFFLVLHLMIAGRLRWKKAGAKAPGIPGSLGRNSNNNKGLAPIGPRNRDYKNS